MGSGASHQINPTIRRLSRRIVADFNLTQQFGHRLILDSLILHGTRDRAFVALQRELTQLMVRMLLRPAIQTKLKDGEMNFNTGYFVSALRTKLPTVLGVDSLRTGDLETIANGFEKKPSAIEKMISEMVKGYISTEERVAPLFTHW